MSDANAYAVIRTAMNDGEFVANLRKDPVGTLAAAGIDDPAQRQELLNILNLLAGAAAGGTEQQQALAPLMQESLKETFGVVTRMKDGLKTTVTQIDEAFQSTMLMYQVSFYLGVALVVVAIGFALVTKGSLLPMVLGGLGTADILTFFFTKPPERLQSSRASLAQLQIALLNWFNDVINQNAFLAQLNQQGVLDMNTFEHLSDVQMEHTERIMRVLQTYCKLIEGPAEKAPPASVPVQPVTQPAAQA
jgi:hypothetical protein